MKLCVKTTNTSQASGVPRDGAFAELCTLIAAGRRGDAAGVKAAPCDDAARRHETQRPIGERFRKDTFEIPKETLSLSLSLSLEMERSRPSPSTKIDCGPWLLTTHINRCEIRSQRKAETPKRDKTCEPSVGRRLRLAEIKTRSGSARPASAAQGKGDDAKARILELRQRLANNSSQG